LENSQQNKLSEQVTKKRSERHKHVVIRQKFPPHCRPILGGGGQDGQNLISWRWSLPLPTDPVWWKSMHAISSYRGNRPTHKQRPPTNTQTGPITIHCAAKLSAQCNDNSVHPRDVGLLLAEAEVQSLK